jgi:hypothetical protein
MNRMMCFTWAAAGEANASAAATAASQPHSFFIFKSVDPHTFTIAKRVHPEDASGA